MAATELFYTPEEVASMFRLTTPALSSQRKREVEPGALAVKVGGKYLYPKYLIDHYLDRLAKEAQASLGLEESLCKEMFRTPPTNRRILTLAESADRLEVEPSLLEAQWENNIYPGALGWRATPDTELAFAPREVEIWVQANANQDRQDAASADSD